MILRKITVQQKENNSSNFESVLRKTAAETNQTKLAVLLKNEIFSKTCWPSSNSRINKILKTKRKIEKFKSYRNFAVDLFLSFECLCDFFFLCLCFLFDLEDFVISTSTSPFDSRSASGAMESVFDSLSVLGGGRFSEQTAVVVGWLSSLSTGIILPINSSGKRKCW